MVILRYFLFIIFLALIIGAVIYLLRCKFGASARLKQAKMEHTANMKDIAVDNEIKKMKNAEKKARK